MPTNFGNETIHEKSIIWKLNNRKICSYGNKLSFDYRE